MHFGSTWMIHCASHSLTKGTVALAGDNSAAVFGNVRVTLP